MKKVLLACAALLLGANAASAQIALYAPSYSNGILDVTNLNLAIAAVNQLTGQSSISGNLQLKGAYTPAVGATPGTIRDIWGKMTLAQGTMGGSSTNNLVGIRGELDIPSGATVNNSSDYLYGMQGKVIGGGIVTTANICGLCGQWDFSSGTYSGGVVSVAWLDAGATASASAISTHFGGSSQLLRMTNTTAATTTQVVDSFADATSFLSLEGPSGIPTYVAAAGTGGSSCGVATGAVAAKVIHITVNGVDYWIPLCSSNS